MGGALEAPPVREISVYGGFPYAGGERAEASVAAYADGDAQSAGEGAAVVAVKAAAQVAQALRSRAARFAPQLLSPAEGLRRALAAPPGLVAVTDPADNPLLPPDAVNTPALFKALLALRPKVATVFAYFADAEVVAVAHAAGASGRLAVTLGAKGTSAFGRGVPVAARVLRLAQARRWCPLRPSGCPPRGSGRLRAAGRRPPTAARWSTACRSISGPAPCSMSAASRSSSPPIAERPTTRRSSPRTASIWRPRVCCA